MAMSVTNIICQEIEGTQASGDESLCMLKVGGYSSLEAKVVAIFISTLMYKIYLCSN